MSPDAAVALRARHRFSDRRHGDFRLLREVPAIADARRQALVALPWTWVHQVHGADVVVVTEPGQHAGARADAVVCTTPGAAIAVHGGDCALLLIESTNAVAVVHAGWRGLLAGVVERTVAALHDVGATDLRATLGPTIGPECYPFGTDLLDEVAARYGDTVRARTAGGHPALDLRAGVTAACTRSHVPITVVGPCTGCSDDHYSFRNPSKPGNQVLVAWLEP